MKYWWVNQKQTYKQEVYEGFMWSPKRNRNGSSSNSYDNMTKIEPGDVVYSYYNGSINAIGIALSRAVSESKPEFGAAGASWSDDGWLVKVDFSLIELPLTPSKHMDSLRELLPSMHSPIKSNGKGNQVYLCQIPEPMAEELNRLLDGQVDVVKTEADETSLSVQDISEERKISARKDIGETHKLQLIKARRGQGLFRKNVADVESACRVTGVNVKSHLIASHIKPWRSSTDDEKLDGNNGLLLSPHIDHLFDRGYISFTDDGAMLVSSNLSSDILKTWAIDPTDGCGGLNKEQSGFMKFHRDNIFKK